MAAAAFFLQGPLTQFAAVQKALVVPQVPCSRFGRYHHDHVINCSSEARLQASKLGSQPRTTYPHAAAVRGICAWLAASPDAAHCRREDTQVSVVVSHSSSSIYPKDTAFDHSSATRSNRPAHIHGPSAHGPRAVPQPAAAPGRLAPARQSQAAASSALSTGKPSGGAGELAPGPAETELGQKGVCARVRAL